jgi:hypothetical protein
MTSMGRTVPTFTNIIDDEVAGWSKFRRGLRIEDQEVFDEIFRAAKLHLAENFYAMRAIPFESIIISVVLEQTKRIRTLECKIQELKIQETSKIQEPRINI